MQGRREKRVEGRESGKEGVEEDYREGVKRRK